MVVMRGPSAVLGGAVETTVLRRQTFPGHVKSHILNLVQGSVRKVGSAKVLEGR